MAGANMVMCRSCGEFVQAKQTDEGVVVFKDECPACGGTEFKMNETGEVIRTDG